jgi:hypothetical protein
MFPNPTFEVNVAGVYNLELEVIDAVGEKSCEPATAQVIVASYDAIHIEVLWDTPADPDQSNQGPEAGADLDLHFTHEYATGPDLDGDGQPDGWFDNPFDCFWFNPNPNWGSFDPSIDDDPSLDLDDTDGAGPESLSLQIPEDGQSYKVGVHYWHDHGYGDSYATVRIYIYGELVYEVTDVQLTHQDMWEVGSIHWPSGEVVPACAANALSVGGECPKKITSEYQNPFFFQP